MNEQHSAGSTETSKHTPGPWSVGHVRPQRVHPSLGPMWEAPIHVGQAANRGNCHTIVSGGGPGALHSTEAAVTANASLIAAAPDLLACLKEMGDWIAGGLQASELAWPDARCLQHTEEMAARARAAVDKAEGRS